MSTPAFDASLLTDADSIQHLVSPLATLTKVIPGFRARDHQKLISDAIVDAQQGRGPRFIAVSVPPQYGKSTVTSVGAPLWWLELHALDLVPGGIVGIVSYEDSLAMSWSKLIRETIEAAPDEFATQLKRDSRGAKEWMVEKNASGAPGGIIAVGINGTITGRSISLLVIDDPTKNDEQAASDKHREQVWNFWQGVGIGRLQPWTTVIVTMCVASGQRVLMADGSWKPIEKVEIGETVASYNRKGLNFLPREVLNKIDQGFAPTLRISTDRHSVVVTAEHPFLKGESWVEAKDLRVGDKVQTVKNLATKRKLWIRELNRYATNDEVWLMGLLWGDGWVTKRKDRSGYVVCLAVKSGRDYEQRAVDALRSLCGNEPKRTPYGYWKVDSSQGGRILERLGLLPGVRAPFKRLPEWLFTRRPHLKRTFLRGLCQADGCQGTGKLSPDRWELVSTSKGMLEDCWELALTCGVKPSRIWTAAPQITQPPNSPKPVETTMHSMSLKFNKLAGVSSRYWRITSIEKGPELPVYDLTVEGEPEHENFVAEGFVVHNTRWRDDDLIGRLMSTEYPGDPEKWRYIRIPAIADPTEEEPDALGREAGVPILRPQADQSIEQATAELAEVKSSISQYHWHTIWLQSPTNPEGTILYADKFRYWGGKQVDVSERYDLPSDFQQMVMSWDMAFKNLTTSDWVVGTLWGRNDMDFFLLEQVRGRWGFAQTCTQVNNFAQACRMAYPKATGIVVEDKANGPAVMDQLRSKVGGMIEFDPSDYGDKIARAWAVQPFLLGGNIFVPAPSERPWVPDFIKELSDFPNTPNDDRVDSTTQAILYMAKYKFQPAAAAFPSGNISNLGPIPRADSPLPFRQYMR